MSHANTIDSLREEMILERLFHLAVEHRNQLMLQIKDCHAELGVLLEKLPKNRPKDKLADLDQERIELECRRTINDQDLEEERAILIHLARVGKLRRETLAYEAVERQIHSIHVQRNNLRDQLKAVRVQADALYSEYQLTKTAHRLGCKKEELVSVNMSCPPEKIGTIFGKNGTQIRQLQASMSVSIDVQTKDGTVRVLGSPKALDAAKESLQRIIDSVEVVWGNPPLGLVQYLITRHISARRVASNQHPQVRFSLSREQKTITMYGVLKDIEALKTYFMALDVIVKQFELSNAEAASVEGDQGSTLEQLVSSFQTVIDVERIKIEQCQMSRITLIGPADRLIEVEKVIKTLAAEVRVETQSIAIDSVIKNVFLLNNEAFIQDMNQRINAGKEVGFVNVHIDGNSLVVHGRKANIPDAIAIVKSEIQFVANLTVTIPVDPIIIPIIIGESGETIKSFIGDKDVVIEVEQENVIVAAYDASLVNDVILVIRDLLAANSVTRIAIDPVTYIRIAKDLARTRSRSISKLCKFSLDDTTCEVTLRGASEKVTQATAIVNEFLTTYRIEDVLLTDEDLMHELLTTGKVCKLETLATEFNVCVSTEKEMGVAEIRGDKNKVHAAVEALNQYVMGADRVAIVKIPVHEQLVGALVGKDGRNKTNLEKKFPSVSIALSSSSKSKSRRNARRTFTLRGLKSDVEACRFELHQLIHCARVSETITLSSKLYERFSKELRPRDIIGDIPLRLKFEKKILKIFGYAADVRDAVAYLNEATNGTYESRLVFPSQTYALIKSSSIIEPQLQSSPIQRVVQSTRVSIEMSSFDDSIIFRGERVQVKIAKIEVFKLLDVLFGASISRIELATCSLLSNEELMSVLCGISAKSKVFFTFDRDTAFVLFFSSDGPNLRKANEILQAKIKKSHKVFFQLKFDSSEDCIISTVIGKKGDQINKLRKLTQCEINVDSTARTILVETEHDETLAEARIILNDYIEKIRENSISRKDSKSRSSTS